MCRPVYAFAFTAPFCLLFQVSSSKSPLDEAMALRLFNTSGVVASATLDDLVALARSCLGVLPAARPDMIDVVATLTRMAEGAPADEPLPPPSPESQGMVRGVEGVCVSLGGGLMSVCVPIVNERVCASVCAICLTVVSMRVCSRAIL